MLSHLNVFSNLSFQAAVGEKSLSLVSVGVPGMRRCCIWQGFSSVPKTSKFQSGHRVVKLVLNTIMLYKVIEFCRWKIPLSGLRWRTWHAQMLYIQGGDRYITTPDVTMAACFAWPRNDYNCGLRYFEVVASSFQPNPHLDLSPSQC